MANAWVVGAGLMSFAALLGATAQVLFKKGMSSGKLISLWLLIGIALYGIGFLINLYVYRLGDASRLYPFIALSYVALPLFAAWWLHEPLTSGKIIGGIIIIVGVAFATLG